MRMENWLKPGVEIRGIFGLIALSCQLLANSVAANDDSTNPSNARPGDCVMFQEGGAGLVIRTPVYWLKGTVVSVSAERRRAERCPEIGKSVSAYTHGDWIRVAAAMPCVSHDAEARDVDVTRLRLAVEAWETPWSNQHGTAGWLFRGKFLDTFLKIGQELEMDATWLKRCEESP
ncbi:MAG: hypothetical protein WCL27_12625 [Betaproteobacteria bacterium]